MCKLFVINPTIFKMEKSLNNNTDIFNNNRSTIKNCSSFPITTLCRYSKLLPFRELPHYFDLDDREFWRYPAYFYGYSYDKYRCNFGLWLTTDTKKNINILMPFFYGQDLKDSFFNIDSNSWLRLRYSIYNSFENKKSVNNFLFSKHKTFFDLRDSNLRYILSDVTLELQKHYNRFHRSINFNSLLELDFSVTNYNHRWWKKYFFHDYVINVERMPFFIMDNSFLSSSFFIDSYDSAIIGYPQVYFEYLYYYKSFFFSISSLNIFFNTKSNIYNFSKIIFLFEKLFLNFYNSTFKSCIFDKNNNLLLFLKFICFKFLFKSNLTFISYFFFKGFWKKELINFFQNPLKNNKTILNLRNFKGFKNNKKNKNKFYYYFYFFLYNLRLKLVKYVSLFLKNNNKNPLMFNLNWLLNIKTKSNILKSTKSWILSYQKELKNMENWSKKIKKSLSDNFLSEDKKNIYVSLNYINFFFKDTDLLFRSLVTKLVENKGMIVYSISRRYCFKDHNFNSHFTDLYFPNQDLQGFFTYKYSPLFFKNLISFFNSIVDFVQYNLNNFININFYYINVNLYVFFNFYFKFCKKFNNKLKIKKRFNKSLKYNKLLLNLFLSRDVVPFKINCFLNKYKKY